MASENFTPPPPPVGVIESLTSGFETVASHLYLIALPLLIDLVLWVGPRISYRQALTVLASSDQMVTVLRAYKELLSPFLPMQYFHPFISNHYLPLIGIPSIIAIRDASALPLPLAFKPPVWNVLDLSSVVVALLLSIQIGLFALIPYLALIARTVKGDVSSASHVFRRMLSVAAQALVVEVIFAAFSCMFLLVLGAIGVALAELVGSDAELLIKILVVTILAMVLMVAILLAFTAHSMFLNDRNILASMWDSMRVVQWNMPATLGLLALVLTIYWGMQYIWRMADPGSWLSLAAIGGNAFISTGLITATFVYFKDRHRYWAEFREQLIAELERRRILQERADNKNSISLGSGSILL